MYDKYAELRDHMGLSDYSVSKKTGVGRSTLSDWKTGKHVPNNENLKKIADFFGVSMEYLLYGEENNGYYLDKETAAEAQRVFSDPDTRMLFDAARDSKPENIRLAAEMLKRFKETNPDG